jgi:heme exporter protein C
MMDSRLARTELKRPLWLSVLGGIALLAFLAGTWFGLVVSPAEATQGELYRITYIHAAAATLGLVGVIVLGVFAVLYLWLGRPVFDVYAVAAAEVSTLFLALTVFGGMIYSKPTLNAFWAWDARLTLSGIMLVLVVGYFVVRALIDDPVRAGRISAVVALIIAAGAPLNRMATTLFRTVHPARSASIPPDLQIALLINMVATLLVFTYLFLERGRLGRLEAQLEEEASPASQGTGGVIRV